MKTLNLFYLIILNKQFSCNYIAFTRFRSFGFLLVLSVFILSFASCTKLVENEPPSTSINEANIYNSDITATSVLTGIYAKMSYDAMSFTGIESISLFAGLSADELMLYPGMSQQKYVAYFKNQLLSNVSESYGAEHWTSLYNLIFSCNVAIEKIKASTSLTTSVKQQLLGEAKFLRAFFYFYLVNLYGDVPLILSTDYAVNSQLSRTSSTEVYQQLINDLNEAKELLSSDYLNGSLQLYSTDAERVRPTKWAAYALLARVYLYTGNWSNAENEATTIIDNSSLFELSLLNDAFLKSSLNNKEAIWQLQPVRDGHNTEDGIVYTVPETGPDDDHPVYISSQLINAFEPADLRRRDWIDSAFVSGTIYYYSSKYKISELFNPVSEYLMVLRMAEQYLIRAEARAQQDNINGAQSDLNTVRMRARLEVTNAGDKQSLLAAIMQERQVELFTEFGHRWFDLKRTGNVDQIMNAYSPLKGGAWQSHQQLYPIPYSDLQKDLNLTQNSGY